MAILMEKHSYTGKLALTVRKEEHTQRKYIRSKITSCYAYEAIDNGIIE